ncbi:hypothetical protein BTO15_10060 [Polaribacter sejongensis]|uniref:Competence protein ComEA n=1 Tax=Polaribacter sejongensis TaxID=985043 RepID=A0ABN5F4M6_9FLAO|nr:helix-hairpin-helix domain-containing protein [Polaribacter sejongensis]AUC22417.1 hypothetical protein BTO15_10060 [Polaribacter sejongensis]
MKILKSHFWYHKSQRNGIFFLILLILIVQSVIVFGNFSSDDKIDINSKQVLAFHQQIDSLRTIEIENRKPKIYPFNPNYITDSKGEQLGMSIKEIDRLLTFRKTNKFVNSKIEFQKVTLISDSLLNKIAPYFKFPDWVVKQNSSPSSSGRNQTYYKKKEKKVSTTDINKATAQDFRTISGIGAAFSERIVNYRTKLQGFSIEDQLKEVWGLDIEVANKVLSKFKIVEKPIINKINVNTASFKALLKNPYIDYSLCKKIFEYRDEVAELQNISELKNIIDFPLDKYDRIVLYLMAE